MTRGNKHTAAVALATAAVLLSGCSSSDGDKELSSRIEVREVLGADITPGCGKSDIRAAKEESGPGDSITFACNRARDVLFRLGPDAATDAQVVGFGSTATAEDGIEAMIEFDDVNAERIEFLGTRPGGTHRLAVLIDGVVMSHASVPDGLGVNRSVRIPGLTEAEYSELQQAMLLTTSAPIPTESLVLSATVPADRGDAAFPPIEVRAVLADGLAEACGPGGGSFGSDVWREKVLACDDHGVGYRLGPDLIHDGDVRSATASERDGVWVVDVRLDDVATASLRSATRDSAPGRVALVAGHAHVLGAQELSETVLDGLLTLTGGDRAFDATTASNAVHLLTQSSSPAELPPSDDVEVEWEA